jgi:hypothetical protein
MIGTPDAYLRGWYARALREPALTVLLSCWDELGEEGENSTHSTSCGACRCWPFRREQLVQRTPRSPSRRRSGVAACNTYRIRRRPESFATSGTRRTTRNDRRSWPRRLRRSCPKDEPAPCDIRNDGGAHALLKVSTPRAEDCLKWRRTDLPANAPTRKVAAFSRGFP